jgi:hypothetical protein
LRDALLLGVDAHIAIDDEIAHENAVADLPRFGGRTLELCRLVVARGLGRFFFSVMLRTSPVPFRSFVHG